MKENSLNKINEKWFTTPDAAHDLSNSDY
jgi:hypothetical protein